MCRTYQTCAELTKFDSDMCRTYKKQFEHVQNITKITQFDMCRTNKIRLQELQKSIRTCAELTKSNSDMCRTYKIGQNTPQNSDKCTRPLSSIEFNLNERVSLTRATSESAHPITPIYLLKPRFSDNSETCLLFIRKQQQIFTTCC